MLAHGMSITSAMMVIVKDTKGDQLDECKGPTGPKSLHVRCGRLGIVGATVKKIGE